MARKNLDRCTLWIRPARIREACHGGRRRQGLDQPFEPLYLYPDRRKPVPPGPEVVETLGEHRFLSVAAPDPLFYRLAQEEGSTEGVYTLFALSDWGLLQLHSSIRQAPMDNIELRQLEKLMQKFARSLEGCFSYAALQEEIDNRRQAEQELSYLAHHDALTGLPNRTLALERLRQWLNSAQPERHIAVLYLDLDRFKNINDTLGHATGDKLLTEVGRRLRQAVRNTDLVARLGGDEFLVILQDVRQCQVVERIANDILQACATPFHIGGRKLFVGCSLGIALYPKDGADLEPLLSHADAALYQAKQSGRNRYQFFDHSLDRQVNQRLRIESALHSALAQGELELRYQPIVDIASGTVRGVESLLRWQHPALGKIPPDVFIPVAEETGLIVPIGDWVLAQSAMAARRLRDATGQALFMSVNVSETQLQVKDFPARVDEALETAGLPPDALHLELTERILIGEGEHTLRCIQTLHAMGVGFSIDDFGTGYSALGYLKRFPCNTIKVDQTFVRDIDRDEQDAALVRAIIRMGQSLSRRIVAEGVETPQQLAMLHQYGCDLAQGYLFSRPLTLVELEDWLKNDDRPLGHPVVHHLPAAG